MGIFSRREDGDATPSIEEFVSQKILTPKLFLTAQPGEEYFRVYGQTKYAELRERLVRNALEDGQPFWQGRVELEVGVSSDGGAPKRGYLVRFGEQVIGELSEFDTRAARILNFDESTRYQARAVMQDDLIGCLVQLFVNPENVL